MKRLVNQRALCRNLGTHAPQYREIGIKAVVKAGNTNVAGNYKSKKACLDQTQ